MKPTPTTTTTAWTSTSAFESLITVIFLFLFLCVGRGRGRGAELFCVPDFAGDNAGSGDPAVGDHLRPPEHRALDLRRRQDDLPRHPAAAPAAGRRPRPRPHPQPHSAPPHPGLVRPPLLRALPHPKTPLDKHSVSRLLQESSASRHHLLSCLRKLKALVSEGERNRRCVESTPGAVEFLASVVASAASGDDAECDVAIDVLASLKLSERRIVEAVAEKNPEFVDALVGVLRRPYYPSRAHAVAILRSLAGALSPARLAALGEDLFREVVRVLRDRVSQQATKAALQALVELAPWGRNRVKAVSAGAVEVVVEILLEGPERRTCELALAAAERLCGCAEGRAALAGHPAGVAAVAKKALRVSHAATDRAVRALCAVARHAPAAAVLAEMASVGAVAKLCLVLQSPDCGDRTKERVREVLRLHSRVWRSSPCLSPQFLALYPPPSSSSSSSSSFS
uniref:U-box domain-containing protein n=1 Tax=Ananas comosus var. bracteatus TaxID=296719 RepID=A0A6V7NIB6_ANACO|nr:unnamed protein product [Ananas comosus var. bracteatus]